MQLDYMKKSSLQKRVTKFMPKKFSKSFGVNLLILFCKLDLFIEMQQKLPSIIKWPGSQKVVNLHPIFYEIDPWVQQKSFTKHK
jgi:hypothetical protein